MLRPRKERKAIRLYGSSVKSRTGAEIPARAAYVPTITGGTDHIRDPNEQEFTICPSCDGYGWSSRRGQGCSTCLGEGWVAPPLLIVKPVNPKSAAKGTGLANQRAAHDRQMGHKPNEGIRYGKEDRPKKPGI